jgi:hypothetical protein
VVEIRVNLTTPERLPPRIPRRLFDASSLPQEIIDGLKDYVKLLKLICVYENLEAGKLAKSGACEREASACTTFRQPVPKWT